MAEWPTVVALIISSGALVVSMLSLRLARTKHNDTKTGQLEQRLDGSDRRLTVVESKVDAMPTRQEMHDLSIATVQLRGDIKDLATKIGGVEQWAGRLEAVTTRIESFLMNQGGSK